MEKKDLLETLAVAELEERLEFSSCCGSDGGDGGDSGSGVSCGGAEEHQCEER